MNVDLSHEVKEEMRAGAAMLDVLPQLEDRTRHLVTFAQATLEAAQDVFRLIERVREEIESNG